jgi:FtsP/CotA-like multicopper oxidase with cupredoxin domain
VMVNATIDPQLTVPAQVVRLRLLNGSSQRVFNIGLEGNKTFFMIASDGGLLTAPLSLTRLQMAPGERAEILVDLSSMNGQTLYLKSYASEFPNGIYGATNPGMGPGMVMNGYKPNPINGTDFNILQLKVKNPTANPVTTIPNTLVSLNPIPEASADTTRSIVMTPKTMGPNQLNGMFLLNNKSFEMDSIDYRIRLGNTEIWSIRNSSAIAHPFHIHDVQFYVLDRNGNPPPPTEAGLKDVILVKPFETVRFITKFEDFTGSTPYMYHCHMLTHEDDGMMGQFIVTDTITGINPLNREADITIYPNPSNSVVNISMDDFTALQQIEIFDMAGKPVSSVTSINANAQQLNLSHLNAGVYFIRFTYKTGEMTGKVLILTE